MAAESQEKQSQSFDLAQDGSKPILKRMNVNFCATGYYESKPKFTVREGRPNNPNDARLSGRSLPVSAWPSHDGP